MAVAVLDSPAGRTQALVQHLKAHSILAIGLYFLVVPRGAEEIRFQVSADHTDADVDEAWLSSPAFRSGQTSA